MKKEEAIKHFTENYAKPYFLESKCNLQDYVFNNKDLIQEEFIKAFKNLSKKAKVMQSTGKKGKIKYINISALRTAMITKSSQFIMEAYNNEWYFDSEECTENFNVQGIMEHLYKFLSKMEHEYRKYVQTIQENDLQKKILGVSKSYFWYVLQIARYSVEKLINTEEFIGLDKEEEYYILSGEYKDKSEIIYCNKNSYSDLKTMKRDLKSADDKIFFNQYFRELDLSNEIYNYYDFRYSSFENSRLSNCEMMGAILSGTIFNNCNLNGGKLSGSIIHDASFENAEMSFVQMEKVYADIRYGPQLTIQAGCIGVNFKGTKIQDSNFDGSILIGGKFNDSEIIQVSFKGGELQKCDFRNALLKDIDFTETVLDNSIFNKEQIKCLKLSNEQMKKICIV